jgi:hypothetical protein
MSMERGSAHLAISQVRIIVEAECSSCGPIFQTQNEALQTLEAATAHTTSTGHLVILNGTIDAPQLEELGPIPSFPEAVQP